KILAAVARGRESLRGRLERAAEPSGVDDADTTQRIRVRRK
ncbi:MAG: hypothetical protein QOG36_1427, partial [Actinomycetota bacterium]|nr:hypothetical protein [Actinomycetota bacterium]